MATPQEINFAAHFNASHGATGTAVYAIAMAIAAFRCTASTTTTRVVLVFSEFA
jgi:hypothetical protein